MQSNQKLIAFFILLIWCFCFDTSIAQVISAPEIDTPLTSSKTYFYNGDIIVPFSSGHVGVTNNAEVNIFSTSEINLLPGFSASIDSGCTELLVGIRNCPEIFILKQIDHITCNGKADGAIRLKCIGGSAPYLFNWSPSNKITSTLTKLVAGTYFVTVTDQSGCTVSDSISIFEPPPFYTEVYTTPSSCHEASGSVTISAFGGVGNYKYFWEHDGGSQSNRSELSAGVYEILVMDSNKCQSNAEASISDADGPEASVEILEQVTCHGFNTGRIRVLKSATFPEPVIPCGGLPNRLAAGSYPILQEDTNGCITMLQVTIDEPDPLSINFFKTSPTCGNNDGKLEASIIGGMEPYSFSWNYLSTDSILNNVSSGIYSLSVADANGCSISRAVFLPDSGSFGLQIAKTDVHCSREQDGQISVSVIGGTPPFNYRWFDSTNEIGGNENIINSLSVGLYTILITDNMGCKNVDSVFISEPEIFDLRLETMNPSYDSTFDGSISVFLTGGVPPYNIQWSNQEDKFNLNSCDSGSYNYIITDQNECELEGSVKLRSSIAIQASSQNPCWIPQRLLPSYSNIQASCTTCNPCSTCTELDIVADFGAIPNDNLSDEESFEWASDFIKNVYCTTGVKLKIPPGKYIVV